MSPDPELMTSLGAVASIFFSCLGSSLGSIQAGRYAMRSKGMLSFAPMIQAGVLAIYGIIISILLSGKIHDNDATDGLTTMTSGYRNLAAGLSVGLACLASGIGMAGFLADSLPVVGTGAAATTRTTTTTAEQEACSNAAYEPQLHAPLIPGSRDDGPTEPDREIIRRLILNLIFLEAIGLYGLIAALVLIGT